MIPFNKPYLSGRELAYIHDAVAGGHISGDGVYTKKCHAFFEKRYGFEKCLLTTSCTDALEMASILIGIKEGDEVIMPSYTFVSTANPFILRGAKIVFCDSRPDHPGMDESKIESLITPKTKAIVPVHYAGVACDMEKIMGLASQYGLFVVEDAAQAIESTFTFSNGITKPLGGIGHLGAFSFHETKNIQCGEGGLLIINDRRFVERAEIIREKGTNRSKFFRGEIDKYGWVDIGSSYLMSDILAAFLLSQLENIDDIQRKRIAIWEKYRQLFQLNGLDGFFRLPFIPEYASNNAHMFHVICNDLETRTSIISKLKKEEIWAVSHYISLHKSPFFKENHMGGELEHADLYTDRLLRLPLYYEMSDTEIEIVVERILQTVEKEIIATSSHGIGM